MTLESLVDALYGDPDVQRMLALSTHSDALQICFPKEVNISRFLAWLLDPTQGHGLGDQAIKSLLTRAGQSSRTDYLSLKDRRFLAASNVQTLAFSSIVVMTEAELGVRNQKRYIDVLAVDPAAKLYIAIENKFGHHEGEDQTKTYYEALRNLYPNYHGIHIFLDGYENDPEHEQWIPVGYTWLTEFLAQVEQLAWTAPHVKSTLAQFRRAIQEEEEIAEGDGLGKLVTTVASKHQEALDALHKILTPNAPSSRAKDLAALVNGSASNDAKANVRLFQLYARRPQVWDRCLKERKFARFHGAMKEAFGHVVTEPRRVVTFFCLVEFGRFLDPDLGGMWPAAVKVRQEGDHFVITSYISLSSVVTAYRQPLIEIVNAERARRGIRKTSQDDGYFTIRRSESLPPAKAATEAVEQMRSLVALLKDLH
ncbi:PD-(D/E)XK nuclease family protein [Pseudomonas putida]|uniref:PDDEXK-like family protein n=1 Tax=Pseudomonas putida TaxID=303 RepID=UPI00383B81F4